MKLENNNMVFVYVPGQGLTEVTKEEAEKITGPIIEKKLKRKAFYEAKLKKAKKYKNKQMKNRKTA